MRGILSWSAYLPYRRLDRTQIAPFVGQGGGKGTRTVASFDEDSTTMAVEAARLALRDRDADADATAVRDQLPGVRRQVERERDPRRAAPPRGSARVRSRRVGAGGRGSGCCWGSRGAATPRSWSPATFAPACPGAARKLPAATPRLRSSWATTSTGPVVAEFLGSASVTEEFVERWRVPGDLRTKVWDEKFSEVTYVPLGVQAWNAALESAGLTAGDVAAAAVVAPAQRVGACGRRQARRRRT